MDSGDLTIAVNFWWRSEMMSGMVEHMDAYYLRRILKRYLVLPIFQGCTLIYTGAQLTLLSISCLFGVQSDLKVD